MKRRPRMKEKVALMINQLVKQGDLTNTQIARAFEVAPATVSQIKNGFIYRRITRRRRK